MNNRFLVFVGAFFFILISGFYPVYAFGCGLGHTQNSDGSCSAVIYANGNDVAFGYSGSASSWENIRNFLSAGVYQLSATESTLRGPQNIQSAVGTRTLIRTAIPFDTRGIPSGATIVSA